MIGLLQRVSHAQVRVDGTVVGAINRGLLVLVGIEKQDDEVKGQHLINRLIQYRVFADKQGRMNNSLQDVQGGLLLVPQFTLAADTQSGKRPSFSSAMPPAAAERLFADTLAYAQQQFPHVAAGRFGADMQVELCNDGPVTFHLRVP